MPARVGVGTVAATSSFPQNTNNSSFASLSKRVARWGGGVFDESRLEAAGEAIQDAVREYNNVRWRFNYVEQDITLVASTPEYTLDTVFGWPLRAQAFDANGDPRLTLQWIPWTKYIDFFPDDTGNANFPYAYTAFNIHEEGKVRFVPKLGATFTWPTIRVTYFSRIVKPTVPTDVLNVPEEVEDGIYQLAVAIHVAQHEGMVVAGPLFKRARMTRDRLEQDYRGFEDY